MASRGSDRRASEPRTRARRGLWFLAGAGVALAAALVLVFTRMPDAPPGGGALEPPGDPSSHAVIPSTHTDPRTTSAPTDPGPGSGTASTTAPATDGYELRGIVRSRSGQPLGGAHVRVRLEAPGIAREIGSADCAADGSYRIALAELSTLEEGLRGVTRLWVRATAAGHRESEVPRSVPVRTVDAPEAPVAMRIECDFALLEGNRLRGRIVDAAGRPVARAEVKLWAAGGGADEKQRIACDEQRTSASGEFILGFTSGGTYALSAREEATGTAYVDPLELEALEDRELGDIVLRGAGVLAGRLRYPDGRAVKAFEIWAVPDALANEENALAAAARRGAESERGEGLYYGRATTAHDGSFRFGGLSAGRYVLRVAQGRAVLEPRQARYSIGKEDIELRLDSCRLVVRVKNRFGTPLAGAVVACSELSTLEDGSLEPAHTMHATAKGAEALAVFDVEPETPLAISATAPGSQTAEEVVIVMAGMHELERELVLEPIGPTGRVRLILPRGPGAPTTAYVALQSAVTRRPLAGIGVLEPDELGWLPPLAPGRYWVEVGFPSRPGAVTNFFPWQSAEAIDVRSDSEQDLVVEPRPGVRLDLALAIAGAPPDDFVRGERERDGAALGVDDPFLIRCGARVRIFAVDGSGERTLQFQIPSATHANAVEVTSQILPGTRAMSETLLELGSYNLRVEAQGFRSVDRSLDLDRPGVVAVEIDLVRE